MVYLILGKQQVLQQQAIDAFISLIPENEQVMNVVKDMSMEGRLTLCNLSIEMGARGGFVAPDETTFEYIKGREVLIHSISSFG